MPTTTTANPLVLPCHRCAGPAPYGHQAIAGCPRHSPENDGSWVIFQAGAWSCGCPGHDLIDISVCAECAGAGVTLGRANLPEIEARLRDIVRDVSEFAAAVEALDVARRRLYA